MMAKTNTVIMPQPQNSPDLSLCEFSVSKNYKKTQIYHDLGIKHRITRKAHGYANNRISEVLRRLQNTLSQVSEGDYFEIWKFL